MQARAGSIVVAWRTQDQDVRVARGTVGALTTQDVETNVPDIAVNASIGLALDATGAPHLVYSYAEDEVVLAIDRAGTWEKVRFGRAFGQGGGAAAVAGTSSVH